MAISSVSSSANTVAVQPQQATRAKDVENDKDKDDSAAKAVAQNAQAQEAPRPTVNTSGQVVGSVINTQA